MFSRLLIINLPSKQLKINETLTQDEFKIIIWNDNGETKLLSDMTHCVQRPNYRYSEKSASAQNVPIR